MIIEIKEYIEATNETIETTIENVVSVKTSCNGPEAVIHIEQVNGNVEHMNVSSDFQVVRLTDSGVIIKTKGF